MSRLWMFTVALLMLSPCVDVWARGSGPSIGPVMSVEKAIEALRSSDQETRRKGLVALLAVGPAAKSAVPAIIEIIEQEAPDVPIEPLVVLERLGPDAKDAVPAIVAYLEKYAPTCSHSFLHVLVAIGPDGKAAVPILIAISSSKDFHCRYLACRASGEWGWLRNRPWGC